MSTGLYDPQVEALVRESLQHRWSVAFFKSSGAQIPLEVISCAVTMDEGWTPYVQGTVVAVVPSAQATLDALDPRLLVRCEVSAGYVLPGGVVNVKKLAVMYLASREVNRPDNTISMSVQGKEYLHDGWQGLFDRSWTRDTIRDDPRPRPTPRATAETTWTKTTEARDAVTRCLLVCGAINGDDIPEWNYGSASWDYEHALQTIAWVDAADPWKPGQGDSAMDIARDIAGRVEGWFRCDETGVFRLTPRPVLDGTTAHRLLVGSDGTVISADTGLSRNGWANAVRVKYSWSANAATGQAAGEAANAAYVGSGPYDWEVVGQVVDTIEMPWKGSMDAAFSRARVRLKQLLSRGRTMSLDAVAAYWLRPGNTVTVQLPLGPQERHLVSAVTFDLPTGSMSVTTRVPDFSSITGGARAVTPRVPDDTPPLGG